jgi:hypothetical protein
MTKKYSLRRFAARPEHQHHSCAHRSDANRWCRTPEIWGYCHWNSSMLIHDYITGCRLA